MATNTEKLQEILSGAQAVAPRIKTEIPVQQIEESVIDVEGGVDPLEVPEIGFPTKKKKQPTAQPYTGLSYSAADEPLQSIDYGDPASFESVQELLTEGTSFAESPQAFSTTGTISTIGTSEGGEDFFDDPADFDEFGSISDGTTEGYSVSSPGTETGSLNAFDKALSDFGNMVEYGTTNPTIETVNSPVGLVATQITDPSGNLTTPGFVSLALAMAGGPVALAGKYGTKALDFINTNLFNAPMTYEQQQRSNFMGLATAADPSTGTGWATYGNNVAYASTRNAEALLDEPLSETIQDFEEKSYAAVNIGGYTYGVDISQIDAKAGITAEQVQENLVAGYIDPEFDVGVAQDIAQALNDTNPAALTNEPLSEMVREIPVFNPVDYGFPAGPDDVVPTGDPAVDDYGATPAGETSSTQTGLDVGYSYESVTDEGVTETDVSTPGTTTDEMEAPDYSETGDDTGDDGGGDKIICTAMNAAYGFGSFRQAIWLQHSKSLSPAYQKGYHALFKPVVRYVYSPKTKDQALARLIRWYCEGMARRRTADIWLQKRGRKSNPLVTVERKFWESLCYLAGKLKWK